MNKYLICLLFCILTLACTKNEVQLQTIDLLEPQQSQNGNVTLNWTAFNIEEGKIFKVMRAENNGDYKSIKIVYHQPSKTLNGKCYTHIDSTFSFACDSIHYKVIVKDDETISSRQFNVRVPRPIKLADNPNRISATIYKVIPELHYILILEKGGGIKLHIYNYLTNELINTISLTSSIIGIGKYNGKYELYCYDGVSQMKYYDLKNSQEPGILNIQLEIGSFYPATILSDNNGHIYCLYDKLFYTIDRTTLRVNKYDLGTDYFKMFYTNDTILCIENSKIDLYTLRNGVPFLEKSKPVPDMIKYNLKLSNRNLILESYNFKVYILNINNWEINTFKNTGGFNSQETDCICADNNRIYSYSYSCFNWVYCYSIPDYIEKDKITLKIGINSMEAEDSYLFYSGSVYTDNKINSYYIFKIKLE